MTAPHRRPIPASVAVLGIIAMSVWLAASILGLIASLAGRL